MPQSTDILDDLWYLEILRQKQNRALTQSICFGWTSSDLTLLRGQGTLYLFWPNIMVEIDLANNEILSPGFLFGYEDELACITDPLGGLVGGNGGGDGDGEEGGEESWWGEWGDDWGWRRRKKREIPSYR